MHGVELFTENASVVFQLLGRDVDINKLLSQRMNEALHKSLDIAISRFEDGDITGIMVSVVSCVTDEYKHGLTVPKTHTQCPNYSETRSACRVPLTAGSCAHTLQL